MAVHNNRTINWYEAMPEKKKIKLVGVFTKEKNDKLSTDLQLKT